MSTTLPPAIQRSDFITLAALSEEGVEQQYGRTLQRLQAFLNVDPATRDLRDDRKLWVSGPTKAPSFGSFGFEDRHWYTYNKGGRNEAQLNVGMFGGVDGHVRIGLGFECTERQGGQPRTVAFIYAAFAELLKTGRDPVARAFIEFMDAEQLEVEVWGRGSDELEVLSADKARQFLIKPREFAWLLVGKLLRPDEDAATLATPASFAATLSRVFAGLRPMWRVTNQRGRVLR